ncbi:hypothetical protein BDP27DRAFT_1416200 [Rhodocollybia butyracea]|uniref:Transmembrane protein n=1 Tax=Rhodocollybia butyracea TaxID=206335 RepID=A0A9P5UCN4_9AGAR|nr:hypothetical protein BDP27DRAFT_1416200 [Rhodocollybia butyracea]
MIVCFVLVLIFGFAAARPQASVTLPEFIPTTSGQNPTSVIGTEWAQPIGTASDGSATTFILENPFTETGLVGTGVLTTVTTTGIETVVVSASGWEETITGTSLPGGVHCFFTASSSGECDQMQVLDDGTTSTVTLTGDEITKVLPVTALLPIFTRTVTDSTIIIESGTPTATPAATTSEKSRNNILGPLLGGLLGGLVALAGVILAAVKFIRSRRRNILDYSDRPLAVESAIEPFTASGTSNRNVTKVTHPAGILAPPSPIPQKTSRSQENVGAVHMTIQHQLEESPPQGNPSEEYPRRANSVSGTLPPSYDQLFFVDRE